MTDESVVEDEVVDEVVEVDVPEEAPAGDDLEVLEVSEGSEDTDDRFNKAESAVQKRIDRLTKKMRSAERDREEAINYAKQVQQESASLRTRMEALDTSYVAEYSTRVETQMGTAEQELARAIDIGDTNGVVEAQRKITSLAIENDRAKQVKLQQDRVRAEAPQQ